MPSRIDGVVARDCGDNSTTAGREPCQMGWYNFAAEIVAGHSVLDVGCGTGMGLEVLAAKASSAQGQDLDPRLASDRISIGPVSNFQDKSVDYCVAIDVVEHVENPEAFCSDLARISRKGFFLTTPNWVITQCRWPYHPREYAPWEFIDLLAPHGSLTYYKGSPSGDEHYHVSRVHSYLSFNRARLVPMVGLIARGLNRILPRPLRVFASHGILVTIPSK